MGRRVNQSANGERANNIMYNERRCLFVLRSKIFQRIYAIAFLGILAILPYAIIYAAVKIFKFIEETKH